ncbi:MAG TPA: S46 family peptidase [Bacteroidales bacterium]|nr:S46 family peptidase [Bacteroidales bacterium]HRZ48859.1 S46 family peptidase [Bacteroidales bacterium]
MKKITVLLLLVSLLSAPFIRLKADEGMWIPLLLSKNYAEMQRLGLKLTPEELYAVNKSSLKDAIVLLDRGSCTGEIISSKGLLLTNHHCGYGEIQDHSTPSANYLKDGFWAYSTSEELPNPKKTASFLVRIDDVTARVLKGVTPSMKMAERDSVIAANIEVIEEESVKDTHYEAEVKEMFAGSEFYLYVYEVFLDVRLVGAPPSSIGKFGGDTDNWMWPRHTGDFTLFRVYCSPDGKPAPYAKENVPYTPKHYLPVSLKGLNENDFAMIWGFPGATDRYRTSQGIQLNIDQIDPAGRDLRRAKMDAMKPYMDADEALKIMYADSYAYLGNFWKKSAEQRKALIALDVVNQKQQQEKLFAEWVNADPERKKTYGSVLADINEAYRTISRNEYEKVLAYFLESFIDPKVVFNAYKSTSFLRSIKEGKSTKEAAQALSTQADGMYAAFSVNIEKALFATMMGQLFNGLSDDYKPDFLVKAHKKYKGDWKKYADAVFKKSIFASKEDFQAFLKKPSVKKLTGDPAYLVMSQLLDMYRGVLTAQHQTDEKLRNANRLYIQGIREMNETRPYYPDANSSMRVTYGKVLSYDPRDAVHYHYLTYLDGVMEKEVPGDEEFDVHPKLKELFAKKDFGVYGLDGRMPVCFLTDNDITGGNSGSPVINGEGHLIGTAFDGNSEAMSSDLQFDPKLQRTIVCDIRYVLFVIDKFAGAKNLIEEMNIIR